MEGYQDHQPDPTGMAEAAILAITGDKVEFPGELTTIPKSMMSRGDICLLAYDGHEYVGVCMGNAIFSTGGPEGNIMLTREQVTEVYAV